MKILALFGLYASLSALYVYWDISRSLGKKYPELDEIASQWYVLTGRRINECMDFIIIFAVLTAWLLIPVSLCKKIIKFITK